MAKKRRPAAHSPWISRDAVTKDLPILDKPPAKRERKAVDLEFRRRIIHARLMAFLLPYAKDKAIEEADEGWLLRLREVEEKLRKRED
jgi:hypothetical protein